MGLFLCFCLLLLLTWHRAGARRAQVEDLDATVRGEGGFGSTGVSQPVAGQ
jgi:hypothetical protein